MTTASAPSTPSTQTTSALAITCSATIDAGTNALIATIPFGSGAGNTVYDSGSGHILVDARSLGQKSVVSAMRRNLHRRDAPFRSRCLPRVASNQAVVGSE